jgi:hypothetical protein
MVLDGSLPSCVTLAARTLAAGELVAFPTETVYGLGADAGNDAAVAKIFAAKGRPSDHPLIVHVADAAGVAHFAAAVPPFAQRLLDAFWPHGRGARIRSACAAPPMRWRTPCCWLAAMRRRRCTGSRGPAPTSSAA